MTEWGWIDGPDPFHGDPNPIGSGGEGGGSGGVVHDGKRDSSPCPLWTTQSSTGQGPEGPRCTSYEQALIREAFVGLMSDRRWTDYLVQFGRGDLLKCLRSGILCKFEFDCDKSQYNDGFDHLDFPVDPIGPIRYKYTFGLREVVHPLAITLPHSLLFALLLACGCSGFEALIISDVDVTGTGFSWTIDSTGSKQLLINALNAKEFEPEDVVDPATGKKRSIVHSRYIWFEPSSGSFGPADDWPVDLSPDVKFRSRWRI